MTATNRLPAWARPVPAAPIDPERVLDAALVVAEERPHAPYTLTISDQATPNPDLIVTEHERSISITLHDLALRIARTGADPAAPGSLTAAVRDWVDTRPVSDADAATKGIATICWHRTAARLGWRVVVPRPSGACAEWIPTVHTGTETVHRLRGDALARAARLTVTPLRAGEVTVWAYLVNPVLSTAALAQPDLLAGNADHSDLVAVVTPGRPVAVGAREAIARLVEETTEPHQLLPLADLSTITWR